MKNIRRDFKTHINTHTGIPPNLSGILWKAVGVLPGSGIGEEFERVNLILTWKLKGDF